MKALSPRVQFPYVCRADRELPEAQRTTFKLCALTFMERAAVDDARWQFSENGTPQLNRGTQRRLALKCGLIGWENLQDDKGAQVPCVLADESCAGVVRARPTDETLARIDLDAQNELAEAILEASRLSDTDRKNS